MPLLYSDVRKVLNILEHSRHLDRVEITFGEYVLKASKSTQIAEFGSSVKSSTFSSPAVKPNKVNAAQAAAKADTTNIEIPEGMTALKAPMSGTFYVTPSPNEPAYVSIGDVVAEGDTLCLVEVMKMFNSILAPFAGEVHQILPSHGQPVAMGELLMILKPKV